jgi:site-specific recombinase XerD
LLTAGTELYTVSKLLGHKDVSVTAIYAKIVDEKRKAAVFSLPNIEVG